MSSSAKAINGTQNLQITPGPVQRAAIHIPLPVGSEESKASGPRIGRPRKPGAKSRNTERYRAWTGYLVRDTVNEAEYLLKRTNPDGTRDARDMSELIQDLLAAWVSDRQELVARVSQTGLVNPLG